MSKIYLNFPITMIPAIYTESLYSALDRIINYGILVYMNSNKLELSEALMKLGIKWEGACVKKIKESIMSVTESPVMTGVEKATAFKYRDSKKSYTKNRESRDWIMLLCGELAIRSIIGVKRYAKCYRGLVLARMAGFASVMSELDYPDAVKRLSGEGGKRQWRKLIASLKMSGCSIYCPKGCRGFYASFRMTPQELAIAVEKKLHTRTEYELSNEELRKIALEQLGRTP